MNWTALIPLKPPAARKSRLASALDSPGRIELTDALLDRVATALRSSPRIVSIILLTAEPPSNWPGATMLDKGRGLNAELNAARAALGGAPMIVIHADLPLVDAEDIAELLDAAEAAGCAIAPDRHGCGTNALAVAYSGPFRYRFGSDSLQAHLAQAGAGCTLVWRDGLSLDCDTPEDLALAKARGFPSSKG